MSPEVIHRKGHSYKADIWSLGGCIIEMLTGHPPYADEFTDLKEVLSVIASGRKPKFPLAASFSALKFLENIYVTNEKLRPSAEELLKHQFLYSN
jgi:serine/threonine protein kinase